MNSKLISAFALLSLALPATAAADEKKDDSKDEVGVLGGFGGTVIYENSVGKGTFSAGEHTRQPYWNMLLSIRPSFELSKEHKVKAWLRLDVNQNIVENFGSANTRPHDVQFGDLRLYVTWAEMVKVGDLSVSGAATLYFPTSRASDIANRYFATALSTTARYSPASWFTLTYAFGAYKSFNEFTMGTTQEDIGNPIRISDPDPGNGATFTGGQNTEWSLSQNVNLGFSFLEKFSFDISWTFYHRFQYTSFEEDELTSPYAQGGKGYNELMVGTLELGYAPLDWLSLALGSTVEQLPKRADNQSINFPFWDTLNGADNRQTFYLDVVATF